MSAYEEYYKERCDTLEAKILSLLTQIETDNEIKAVHEIEYRKEVDKLKEQIGQHIKWNEAHTNARVELFQENKNLKEVLELLITEIDVIERTEDTPISEEAYSKAVKLLKER